MDKSNCAYSVVLLVLVQILPGCDVAGGAAGDDPDASRYSRVANIYEPLAQKPAPSSCTANRINSWIHESMLDYYLFFDQAPQSIDLSLTGSPEELMRTLRVSPNDRYSYVTDETTYNAFFNEGEAFGYGWNFARNAADELVFSLVDPNSPLETAGVQRGDVLLAINGYSITRFNELSSSERTDILGDGDQVRTLQLDVRDTNDQTRQLSVTKGTYILQTVLDSKVLEINGNKIGYLSFYQFVNTSSAELGQAFANFNAQGVNEMIIDLRFNGGGRISVANELASAVLGDNHTQDIFTTFAFNSKYSNKNASINFQDMSDSLSLSRVFVLQSGNTCSASELVVNSLRPFMEVITIGSTSCGKPYATSPNVGCGKVANALEIELLNANGAGGYFNGITADCPVSENLSTQLGNSDEPLLATALRYIDTGNCSAGVLAGRSKTRGDRLTDEFKQAWQGGSSR